jgi:hypothetical protein
MVANSAVCAIHLYHVRPTPNVCTDSAFESKCFLQVLMFKLERAEIVCTPPLPPPLYLLPS